MQFAGSGSFARRFYEGQAQKLGAIGTALKAKTDADVSGKTLASPAVGTDIGAIAKGASSLVSGLGSAFKPQTPGRTNPYAMDYGSWNPAQQYGMDLGDTSSFWNSSGGVGGIDASAFSAPAGTFDFGFGDNFTSTAFGR